MAQGAKVDSIDAIKMFRAALIKFAETGNVAMSGAESDIDRTLGWLEREQTTYWNGQFRKRHEDVMKCEEAVRQKRLFKGSDGRVQSAVDEQKALNIAKRRKEEAEQKILAVKKAIQVLRKEAQLYKGRVQKLATALQSDIPRAVHMIDNMLDELAIYLSIQTTGAGIASTGSIESVALSAPSEKVGTERFRDLTPSPEQRALAALKLMSRDDSIFQPWGAGLIEDWQLEALAKLSIEKAPIDPDQKVVIARDSWTQPKIYLERLEPAFEGDTGWYFASTTPPETAQKVEYDAIRVGDLMAARPDLKNLLELPTGFLIVLDSGGPSAMLDAAGLDVWSVAMMMSAPPEEPPADEPSPAPAAG